MFVFISELKKNLANDFNTELSKLVRQVEESGGLDYEWKPKIFQVKFKNELSKFDSFQSFLWQFEWL